MWYIHIVVYFSAIERNEILIYTTTWLYFEIIMVNERKRPHIVQLHLYEIFSISKSVDGK